MSDVLVSRRFEPGSSNRNSLKDKHVLVLSMFGIHSALFVFAVWLTVMMPKRFPLNPQYGPYWHAAPMPLVDGMIRWDASYYLNIAAHGYASKMYTAFFPVYPLMVRGVGDAILWLHGPFAVWGDFPAQFVVAGFLVANLSFLGTLYALHTIASVYSLPVANRAVIILALFPTSFFLSTIYSEPLFMLLVCLAFVFGQKRWWIAAAVAAGLAALTRNIGFIVVLSLLVMVYRTERTGAQKHISLLAKGALVIAIPLCMFFLYPVFLFVNFHHAFEFLTIQKVWERDFVIPWSWFWTALTLYPMDFLAALAFTLITIFSWRTLRLEDWLFLFIGLLIPLSSAVNGDPRSMLRLVLVLFPAMIWLAMKLHNRNALLLYLLLSGGLFIAFTTLYSTWTFVA